MSSAVYPRCEARDGMPGRARLYRAMSQRAETPASIERGPTSTRCKYRHFPGKLLVERFGGLLRMLCSSLVATLCGHALLPEKSGTPVPHSRIATVLGRRR
jgi:hypothetical protein